MSVVRPTASSLSKAWSARAAMRRPDPTISMNATMTSVAPNRPICWATAAKTKSVWM